MHFLTPLFLFLSLLSRLCQANVEKTIFLAPAPIPIPSQNPAPDDLGLERLSPQAGVLRTYLNASFPTEESPLGTVSWFFLEDLNPGQRYEVRVCWSATQPTAFTLTTHTLPSTLEDASLMSSITTFSSARLASLQMAKLKRNTGKVGANAREPPSSSSPSPSDSVLFLRIHAAADYFTLNTSLMENVPPVLVDVILDPYLLNVFPRSLVPTAGWIAVVAGFAWVVARGLVGAFSNIAEEAEAADGEGKKKR